MGKKNNNIPFTLDNLHPEIRENKCPLKGPQQSTSYFLFTTVKQLLTWLLAYVQSAAQYHCIAYYTYSTVRWTSAQRTPANYTVHIYRSGGQELKMMTHGSELHTWRHAIVMLQHKQKGCKQDGWVCDGSMTPCRGCYCKCVTCDFNCGHSVWNVCLLTTVGTSCCSLSWWLDIHDELLQRLPVTMTEKIHPDIQTDWLPRYWDGGQEKQTDTRDIFESWGHFFMWGWKLYSISCRVHIGTHFTPQLNI